MCKHLIAATSVALFIGVIALAGPAAAQAKTAKVCTEEYKAAKPALKAAKEKKGEFISACRALPVGTPTPIGSPAAAPANPVAPSASPTRTSTVGALKTAGACNDEYKANKGALKDAKEKKKDFITACRAAARNANADRDRCRRSGSSIRTDTFSNAGGRSAENDNSASGTFSSTCGFDRADGHKPVRG